MNLKEGGVYVGVWVVASWLVILNVVRRVTKGAMGRAVHYNV